MQRYNTITMKKVVRTVWISLLTGLAFLGACCTSKGGRRAECIYGPPEALEAPKADTVKNVDKAARRAELQKQLDSLEAVVKRRETACVYGSPEVMDKYRAETSRIRQQVADIKQELVELGGDKAKRRAELQQRLDSLQAIIRDREMSCVYGSPEIIQSYGQETNNLHQEADKIQEEIDKLDEEE